MWMQCPLLPTGGADTAVIYVIGWPEATLIGCFQFKLCPFEPHTIFKTLFSERFLMTPMKTTSRNESLAGGD